MSISIPIWLVRFLVIASGILGGGLALWVGIEVWFKAIDKAVLLLKIKRDLFYFFRHRKRLKEIIAKERAARTGGMQ